MPLWSGKSESTSLSIILAIILHNHADQHVQNVQQPGVRFPFKPINFYERYMFLSEKCRGKILLKMNMFSFPVKTSCLKKTLFWRLSIQWRFCSNLRSWVGLLRELALSDSRTDVLLGLTSSSTKVRKYIKAGVHSCQHLMLHLILSATNNVSFKKWFQYI